MTRLIISMFVLLCCPVQALTVHRLISDSAVLQRNHTIPVKGTSESETVSIWLNDTLTGKAKVTSGQWEINLPAREAGGPFTLKIRGDSELTFSDIYFGDVFLASGQSNMELTMARVEEAYPEDVSQADFPLIREFTVPDKYRFDAENKNYEAGKWLTATPQNIRQLSAVGYYFANKIHNSENVPVGIINAALGGSPIEAWMARETLAPYPDAIAAGDFFAKQENIIRTQEQEREAVDNWYKRLNDKDKGMQETPWYTPELDDSQWQSIAMPENLKGYDEGFAGVWWLRKHVHLDSVPDQSFILRLGRIVDADEAWVNGVKVGNTTYQYPPRRYTVPASALKKGDNVITVRVTSNGGATGFVTDKPYFLGASEGSSIPLDGDWKYKLSYRTTETPATTFIRWKPMGLFNAMIAPAAGYPLSGVLWYQGESNASRPSGYSDKLIAMMANWRSRWEAPDLPFFIIQLTNFMERKPEPGESSWAELRGEQAKAAADPATALIVTIDIGEWNDIHPVNKREVGHRVALAAENMVYRKNVDFNGPIVKSVKSSGKQVELTFDSPLDHERFNDTPASFAIAGADGNYKWAKSTLQGNKVILSHPAISKPEKVRYAWADNPAVSVYDLSGLPAAPFEMNVSP